MHPRPIACACACAALVMSVHCAAATSSPDTAADPGSGASQGKLPGSLPVRRQGDVQGGFGWGPFAGLGLLAVGAAGWWAWTRQKGRRGPRTRPGETVAVVRLSSQALTPQASVHAVRWNGQEYLLGCTAQHVTLLSRREVMRTEGETS